MIQDNSILLGRHGKHYIDFPGSEHAAVHARSGTGKTVSVSIPNCFAFPGSLIILDIKGTCWQRTAGHRYARLGQSIYKFDPTAEDGRSHRWNPFSVIDRASPDRFDMVSRQAYQLFPEGSGSSNAERFWEPAGRAAFTAVACLLAETPEEPLTLANVLRIFTRGDFHEWLSDRISRRRQAQNPYSSVVVEGVSDFLGGGQDLVESIRKTVATTLSPFFNPKTAAATETSDFDLRELRRTPMSIYVTIAPGHLPRMRPIMRLFFDQVINQNTTATVQDDLSLRIPVLLLLDEFVQLGKVVTLAHAIQFVREYGIRILLVIQDKDQLQDLYGLSATKDIFNNLGVEIVFGTGDIKLAKELEDRMGDDTVLFDTINKPRFFSWMKMSKQGTSQHPHRRPLRYDQEIVMMPKHRQLILRPGMLPMETDRIEWFSDPHFTKLECPPPEVPLLRVEPGLDDGSVVIPARRTR